MFEEYLEILRSKESLLRIKERLNKKMIINFQRVEKCTFIFGMCSRIDLREIGQVEEYFEVLRSK